MVTYDFREIVRYAKTLDKKRPLTASLNVEIEKDKLVLSFSNQMHSLNSFKTFVL